MTLLNDDASTGFGGQVDFIRGAAEGFDGKGRPIIALSSATKRNESKIIPTIKSGMELKFNLFLASPIIEFDFHFFAMNRWWNCDNSSSRSLRSH